MKVSPYRSKNIIAHRTSYRDLSAGLGTEERKEGSRFWYGMVHA
jgi:hypothetical protein